MMLGLAPFYVEKRTKLMYKATRYYQTTELIFESSTPITKRLCIAFVETSLENADIVCYSFFLILSNAFGNPCDVSNFLGFRLIYPSAINNRY